MKKRFLFLLLGLNLILVSSISMSVAWFLGSINLFVDDINIVVDVDADLKISMNDNDFEYAKETLTVQDFGAVEHLIPVSSMGSEHSRWIENKDNTTAYFKAQYKSTNQPVPPSVDAVKGFFQRRFYLYSTHHMLVTYDSQKSYVKANSELNELIATKKANEKAIANYRKIADEEIAGYGVDLSEGQKQQIYNRVRDELGEQYHSEFLTNLNKVEDSLRISILDYENLTNSNYTIIDPKKTEDPVVFGGRLSTSVIKDYYDFHPDYETIELKETLFGDIKSQDHDLIYLDAKDEDTPTEGEHTCFNAGTRRGVRALDMDDLKYNIEFYTEQSITPEQADVSTHPDNENEGYLIELIPGVAHPLTLSVYLEGWDRDNVDATQEASFDMSIHFRLYRQGD